MRVLTLALAAALLTTPHRGPAVETEGASGQTLFFCRVERQSGQLYYFPVFAMPASDRLEVLRQKNQIEYQLARHFRNSGESIPLNTLSCWDSITYSTEAVLFHFKSAQNDSLFKLLDWVPPEAKRYSSDAPTSGKLKSKTVYMKQPSASRGEKGWGSPSFEIEYKLLACAGELWIAYNVIEGSLRYGHSDYLLDGAYYKISNPPKNLGAVSLSGAVTDGPTLIGEFGDKFASQSLGFDCYTGQTKEVAKLKDHLHGKAPTKQNVQAFIDRLDVHFSSNDIMTSTYAEQEIRSGKASVSDGPKEGSRAKASGPSDAELRAQARAAKEAEYQEAVREYEAKLAEQQQAVAKFEEDTRKMEAEKAAQAQRAAAAAAEYARKIAAHQAEVERLRQEQGQR